MGRIFIILSALLLCFSCIHNEDQIISTGRPFGTSDIEKYSSLRAHWPFSTFTQNNSLELGISQEFNNQEIDAIETMMNHWNEVIDDFDFFRLPVLVIENKNYVNLEDYYDDELGIYKSFLWFDDVGPDALALTQFFAIPKDDYLEIIHADIIINYKYYDFSLDELDYFTYDLPSVLLHELGHILGLKHDYQTSSIMQPNLTTFESRRTLTSYDIETIKLNYQDIDILENMSTNRSIKKVSHFNTPDKIIRIIIEMHSNKRR